MNKEELKAFIADLVKVRNAATDEIAVDAPHIYPRWSGDGIDYYSGDRVLYDDILYKVLTTHTSQETWTPTDAPSLFAKVLISDADVIPEWEQPDSTNPYMNGDKVTYNGKTYVSTIDNNIWSPDAYPAGWEEV